MWQVGPPELLGVIDFMEAMLRRGEELERKGGAAAASPAGEDAAASLGATHGVGVTACSRCRTVKLHVADLLRHVGQVANPHPHPHPRPHSHT